MPSLGPCRACLDDWRLGCLRTSPKRRRAVTTFLSPSSLRLPPSQPPRRNTQHTISAVYSSCIAYRRIICDWQLYSNCLVSLCCPCTSRSLTSAAGQCQPPLPGAQRVARQQQLPPLRSHTLSRRMERLRLKHPRGGAESQRLPSRLSRRLRQSLSRP